MKKIAHQHHDFPTRAPVMVLPNASLFPASLLPLRIFEERYRAMLHHALEHDRMFCVAQMKPGVSEAATESDFFRVGGLGLIRAAVQQADGASHLVLQGLARVEMEAFEQTAPFRIARIRELRSETPNQIEAEALSAKVIELCESLKDRGVELPKGFDKGLREIGNPEMLSDIVSHAFIHDPLRRQDILEELIVSERLRSLIRYLQREIK